MLFLRAIPHEETDALAWYYYDKAFSSDECSQVIELAHKYKEITAELGPDAGHLDKSARDSRIRWIYPEDTSEWLFKKLEEMIVQANDQNWKFNLHAFYESIQYTVYDPGSAGYSYHYDIGNTIQSQRKVSVTVNLNDDFEGGELQLRVGAEPVTVKPEKGKVVVFPSYMLHRVLPVKSGTRRSLVLWVGGDHYR